MQRLIPPPALSFTMKPLLSIACCCAAWLAVWLASDALVAAEIRSEEVQPLLAKYCAACHGPTKPKAELNLAALTSDPQAKTWELVWKRLQTRQMPPADHPQPTPEERRRITAWIEATFAARTLGGQPDPGPLRPRRLNVRELMNTYRDLVVVNGNTQPRKVAYVAKPDGSVNLYQAIVPPPEHPCAFVPQLLPPDTQDGGFDTIGENLSIPPFLVEKYLRCSKRVLDDLVAVNRTRGSSYQSPLYSEIQRLKTGPFPKDQTPRQAMVRFLQNFASRAFRRKVTSDEVEKYARLFDQSQEQGQEFETSIRVPLEAILIAPRTVVLWAEGTARAEGEEKPAAVRPLDGDELATRLAYFLWSSIPDRELTQLAEKGSLSDPLVLEQQVRRMLADRRITDGLLAGFVCQWLQLDRLDRNAPDAARYPAYFQDNLAELMKRELLLYCDAILVEDRSILEFIDSDWGFVCYPLAQHYGLDNFPGKKPPSNADPPWYRVQLTDKRRGGVLTMGKVLTGTSQPLRTSPVRRGKWVLETILGAPPPPPPADVNNVLPEAAADKERLTVPQLLAQHRANAGCTSCHRMIDPLGLAFESFDPTGKWRDLDAGQKVDPRGTLADGTEFQDVQEFKTLLLARKDDFARCFTEQMLAYALGRKLELYDAATVRSIAEAARDDDYKFSRVVVEIAKSYPFRHRRAQETAE